MPVQLNKRKESPEPVSRVPDPAAALSPLEARGSWCGTPSHPQAVPAGGAISLFECLARPPLASPAALSAPCGHPRPRSGLGGAQRRSARSGDRPPVVSLGVWRQGVDCPESGVRSGRPGDLVSRDPGDERPVDLHPDPAPIPLAGEPNPSARPEPAALAPGQPRDPPKATRSGARAQGPPGGVGGGAGGGATSLSPSLPLSLPLSLSPAGAGRTGYKSGRRGAQASSGVALGGTCPVLSLTTKQRPPQQPF